MYDQRLGSLTTRRAIGSRNGATLHAARRNNVENQMRITIAQEEVLRNIVGRTWGGSGGPQTAMQKLQAAFPEFAPVGGGFTRRVTRHVAQATTEPTGRVVAAIAGKEDPYGIGELATLEGQLREAI